MTQSELTFKEAANTLTGFDVITVEKKFNKSFEDLGGIRSLAAVIWVYENRREATSWDAVLSMSLDDYNNYFTNEEHADPEK